MILYCKECGIKVSFSNIGRVKDLDFSSVGCHCRDCAKIKEDKLKAERFVEEYKGNKIYCKDVRYTPYWQSPYYFNTVEDARNRIDNSNIAIVPTDIFNTIMGQF